MATVRQFSRVTTCDKGRHDVEPREWPRRGNGLFPLLSPAAELTVYTKQHEKIDTSIHIFIFSFRDPEEAVCGATNRKIALAWTLVWTKVDTAAEIGGSNVQTYLGKWFGHCIQTISPH